MRFFLAPLLSMQMLCAYDTVFILHDATETQALLPVINVCLRNHEDICVLTAGPASEILAGKPNTVSFEQLGIEVHTDWSRDKYISSEHVQLILEKFPANRVVTGTTCEYDGQLLKAYSSSQTFAYWDNINYEEETLLSPTEVASFAQHLLVSSKTSTPIHPHLHIVGQPSLEKEHFHEADASKIRAALPFPLKSPVIAFFGGYGDDYKKALSQFLNVADQFSDYTILLLPHPRTDGAIERAQLSCCTPPHVHLIEPTWNLSATDIAALADHILCHPSIAGIHAAAAKKDVAYWTPCGQHYTNPFIENGAFQIGSAAELKTYLTTPHAPPRDLFELLHIPRDAARLIYEAIHGN